MYIDLINRLLQTGITVDISYLIGYRIRPGPHPDDDSPALRNLFGYASSCCGLWWTGQSTVQAAMQCKPSFLLPITLMRINSLNTLLVDHVGMTQ